jgi:hypothetical protein
LGADDKFVRSHRNVRKLPVPVGSCRRNVRKRRDSVLWRRISSGNYLESVGMSGKRQATVRKTSGFVGSTAKILRFPKIRELHVS